MWAGAASGSGETTVGPRVERQLFESAIVKSIIAGALVGTIMAGVGSAQVPTGMVAGTVHDPSSAVIPGAQVEAVSRTTRQSRTSMTGEHGEYSFPALMPGDYEINVEAAGFQRTVR